MKRFKYRLLEELNEGLVNDLGFKGYKMCRFFGSPSLIIMELEYEVEENEEDLMPVAKTISDPLALYRCMEKVKRYDWGNTYVHPEFLTLEDFKNGNFYSDDGEYEAYLSDGFYFIGTNLRWFSIDECDNFIRANKNKFRDSNNLKVYYIDYPEDK
jgi:hypothetical protein